MLLDALLVLGADDVREPVEVGDDVVEDAALDGVRVVDRGAARAAGPASPRSPRSRGGRGWQRALEVQVEDAVRIGIGQNDLTGRRPRQVTGADHEGPLIEAHQPLVAVFLQLGADVLVNGDPAGEIGAGPRGEQLVEGAGQHAGKAGVPRPLARARHVLDELVVDPFEQKQVAHVGLQRILKAHRAQGPAGRVVPGGGPVVDAAEHPVGPGQDVEPLDAADVAGRVGAVGVEHRQQRRASPNGLEKAATRETEITLHHFVLGGSGCGHRPADCRMASVTKGALRPQLVFL